MKRKVNKVHEVVHLVITPQGGENEFHAPHKDDQKKNGAPPEIKGVGLHVHLEEKLSDRNPLLRCGLLLLRRRLFGFKRDRPALRVFLEDQAALGAFLSVIPLFERTLRAYHGFSTLNRPH